jgi:hypothetical protein
VRRITARRYVPGKIVAIQQFLGKLRNQMALRHFGHAEGRDDTGHVFLHDGAGDRSAHILLKGNIGVLQPEHHHGQTLVLAILGEPEAPPDIDRIKDDEGDIVLEPSWMGDTMVMPLAPFVSSTSSRLPLFVRL